MQLQEILLQEHQINKSQTFSLRRGHQVLALNGYSVLVRVPEDVDENEVSDRSSFYEDITFYVTRLKLDVSPGDVYIGSIDRWHHVFQRIR